MANKLLDGLLKPEKLYRGKKPNEFYTLWEPGVQDRKDLPRRDRVRLMSYMGFYHPFFWEVNAHPAIVDVMREIWGTGVQYSPTRYL